MLMIWITRRALITGCKMKRMQQNSIMAAFKRPEFVFLIGTDLARLLFCFVFSPLPPDACKGETAANFKTQPGKTLIEDRRGL